MALRVLMLTQWFDPESFFKGLVFARELQRQGFEVEVLTGFPNYPGGKLYPGYRVRWYQKEMMDGIRVNRVPLYPSHDRSAWRRVLNYASFAASSLIYGLFFARRPDVIYAYHPPLTVGVTASLIRLFRRIPVVYDVQDMWPDTLKATGMINSPKLLRVIGKVCQWVYKRVDHIVVLSPGFKKLLIERGVPAEKVTVIRNWADEKSLLEPKGQLPDSFPTSDYFRILFAGNMGKAQALDAVLDAAALSETKSANIVWIFLGDGVEHEQLKRRAADMALQNIVFLPRVPGSEVGSILSAADALLVHLRKDPLFKITIPSKTQAYLAVGKPILMAVEGDAADLVQEAQAGLAVQPEDANALYQAVLRLSMLSDEQRAAMARAGKAYYQEQLCLEVGARRFGKVISEVAGGRSA